MAPVVDQWRRESGRATLAARASVREETGRDRASPAAGYERKRVGGPGRWPDACEGVITDSAQAFVEDRTLADIREAQAAFADPAQVARLARYHSYKARWVLDARSTLGSHPKFAGGRPSNAFLSSLHLKTCG